MCKEVVIIKAGLNRKVGAYKASNLIEPKRHLLLSANGVQLVLGGLAYIYLDLQFSFRKRSLACSAYLFSGRPSALSV